MRKFNRPINLSQYCAKMGGGKLYIAILLFAILLSTSSCKQIVFVPVEEPKEWTITIVNNPAEVGTSETFSRYTNQKFTLPDPEPVDGYSFDNYSLPDGTELQVGDRVKYDGSDITITANWSYEINVDTPDHGTGTNSISDAINSANGKNVVINLPSAGSNTTYNEDDPIEIAENQHVTINGTEKTALTGRALTSSISENAVTINGSFTLSKGSSLTLNNVKLMATPSNHLISSVTGGVEVNILNSSLTTAANKYGIFVNVSENPDQPVSINIENTYAEMKAETGAPTYGATGVVFVRGDSTQKHDYDDQLDHAAVTIMNSEFKDISEGNFSVIPVELEWTDEIDLTVENTDIAINKNHYAIRFYGVGTENTVSDVSISHSSLTAWASFYVQADSKNVKGTIDHCTLTGINENSGPTDGFSTISIDSSSGIELDVKNSTVIFNKNAEASQKAASIYYYDNTGIVGGNVVNFKNCSIEFNQTPTAELPVLTSFTDSIMTKNGEVVNGYNYISFDDATINSLAAYGYKLEETAEKLAINPADQNIGSIDEDGYTIIKYSSYCFYNPAFSGNRVPDNQPYQFIQTSFNLVPSL